MSAALIQIAPETPLIEFVGERFQEAQRIGADLGRRLRCATRAQFFQRFGIVGGLRSDVFAACRSYEGGLLPDGIALRAQVGFNVRNNRSARR
jgi:hypothetical protein